MSSRSMLSTSVPSRNSAPVSATVARSAWSQVNSGSVHSFLLSAGRGYGASTSALRMAIDPFLSMSRIPRAAESAAIPPPTMRYWYVVISAPRMGFIVETMRTPTTVTCRPCLFEGSSELFALGQASYGISARNGMSCHEGWQPSPPETGLPHHA